MTSHEHDQMARLDDKMDTLNDKFDAHNISDERRFGRIEKLILLVGILVVMPKLGGPSASALVTHVATVATTIL